MQNKNEKTLQLREQIGTILKFLRENRTNLSCNKLEEEYELSRGSLNRIENGRVDCKFITLWKIAEALGMKPSELVMKIEKELGDDFKLIDE